MIFVRLTFSAYFECDFYVAYFLCFILDWLTFLDGEDVELIFYVGEFRLTFLPVGSVEVGLCMMSLWQFLLPFL